jgi:hypothetical protein
MNYFIDVYIEQIAKKFDDEFLAIFKIMFNIRKLVTHKKALLKKYLKNYPTCQL